MPTTTCLPDSRLSWPTLASRLGPTGPSRSWGRTRTQRSPWWRCTWPRMRRCPRWSSHTLSGRKAPCPVCIHHMLHKGTSDGVEGKVHGDTCVRVRVHESVECRVECRARQPGGVPCAFGGSTAAGSEQRTHVSAIVDAGLIVTGRNRRMPARGRTAQGACPRRRRWAVGCRACGKLEGGRELERVR